MHNPEKNKYVFIVSGIMCFLLAAVLLHSFKGRFVPEGEKEFSSTPIVMEDTINVTHKDGFANISPVTNSEPKEWAVYLTGAIKKPGVYYIASNSRIYQALELGGGFATDANQEAVNLAAKMVDGAHIHFPRKGEELSGPQTSSIMTSTGNSSSVQPLLNINTATQNELESIPGVGPKTAQLIITHRETKGAFTRLEDLLLIKGIGAKKYDGLKDFVSITR